MTEEEAKQKWCPFAHRFNRMSFLTKPKCIASDCMAWRWHIVGAEYTKINEDLYIPVTYKNSGYCGLAGKP